MNLENTSDFFDSLTLSFYTILREKTGKRADMMLAGDLLERGKNYIMTMLSSELLRETFKDDPTMFYYNVASNAFGAGIAYCDAWEKDVTQVKLGFVDALVSSQPDIHALATDIMGVTDKDGYIGMIDSMFEKFLSSMQSYWLKEDPRPFLFQGLLAFFQSGINYRKMK